MELIALLQGNAALWIGVVFALGLLVGSFLNVVILRLPVMLERQWKLQCQEFLEVDANGADQVPFNLITPRSRCPHCGHQIGAAENIPILSYLLLRGRCRECHNPIGVRYPAVELFTALISAAVAWRFGFSVATAVALVFTWSLVALSFIDIDHKLLPDAITLPLLWAGLLVNIPATFVTLQAAVIGAAAGYLVLWLVYHAFRLLTGKEGMGYGDFKLLAALGAWLGWSMLPLILILSSLVGAAVGIAMILLRGQDSNIPIPFGPYLAAAGWLALLWGPDMLGAYLSFSGLAP